MRIVGKRIGRSCFAQLGAFGKAATTFLISRSCVESLESVARYLDKKISRHLLLGADAIIEYLRGRPKAIGYPENLTYDVRVSVISTAELLVALPVAEKTVRLGGLRWSGYRRNSA